MIQRKSQLLASFLPFAVFLVTWIFIVVIVNPVGEFMINDDWCYVRALERLLSDRSLVDTGWGPSWAPGGPSLLCHLLWGGVFVGFGGFSLTTLRISVLVAGFLGSATVLVIARSLKLSVWAGLWASLTLVLNPLFLSQSFTFMTDVTFTCFAAFSVLFLFEAVREGRRLWLVAGLMCCLASVLTRQIGIVIAVAFVVVWCLHPPKAPFGRARVHVMVAALVLLPWIAYEWYLFHVGGTPLFEHQVLHRVWNDARDAGFPGYLGICYLRLFHGALPYACLFVSPVLCLRFHRLWASRLFRWFFFGLTGAFLIFEILLLLGCTHLPVRGLRNVIFNVGIGPILLKDEYILCIRRTPGLAAPLYAILVYWAVVAMGGFAGLAAASLKNLFRSHGQADRSAVDFLASLSLVAALLYLATISVTGLHDRYLIPVCLFLILWVLAEWSTESEGRLTMRSVAMGIVPLAVFGWFSVAGTADFMALKRAQKQAHDYLVNEAKSAPCRCDGGLEFNAYHCYKADFQPRRGMSWWWVEAEDYLVTLGPLEGYTVVQTFPFSRLMGPSGKIHVLKHDRIR